MKSKESISRSWDEISRFDAGVLNANKFALGSLYGSEAVIGLTPLSAIPMIEVKEDPILTKNPAFKNLDFKGIQHLRSLNFNKVNTVEVNYWAETLMRYLEINLTVLKKKCINTFGSLSDGKEILLELTAFLMDQYFSTKDLRFINIVLKLMDQHWLYSNKKKIHLDEDNKKSMYTDLLKVRLWIMREAALKMNSAGAEHA